MTKASDFDDAADRWSLFESLDASEAHMVRASVCSVDQGVSLAGQFVMQSKVDQPSHDPGTRLFTFDDVVGNAARFPALGKGAVHGLDDVPAHSRFKYDRWAVNGAERKARPLWRATRAFTTTRRVGLNNRVRLKASRPRPKVERP